VKNQAKNRLVMTKASIAARRASGKSDYYSWVWVVPRQDGRFRVVAVEVPKRLVDDEECFFEDDMTKPYEKIVERIEEVDGAVRDTGVDPETLDAPWHSDFPL